MVERAVADREATVRAEFDSVLFEKLSGSNR
jgi:hypothetical protein